MSHKDCKAVIVWAIWITLDGVEILCPNLLRREAVEFSKQRDEVMTRELLLRPKVQKQK